MIKEAIEKIREMAINEAGIKTITIDNGVYSKNKDGELVKIAEQEQRPKIPAVIPVTSLEGLVNWVKRESSNREGALLFVEVSDYNEVVCRTERGLLEPEHTSLLLRLMSKNDLFREGFRDYETAMIELRSKYQHTDDIDYLLKLLGSMTLEDSVKSDDNGLTQQVTVRKGIALTENKTVKPIVKLKPYRTFFEVEQPESEFLVRISDNGNIGFFEADGGMWELKARYTIKEYLKEALADEIESGSIIVTL